MNEETGQIHRRHRMGDEQQRDTHVKLRNILNGIFMLTAIVGVIWYFVSDTYVGTIIILSGMVFKFAEYIIRIFKI